MIKKISTILLGQGEFCINVREDQLHDAVIESNNGEDCIDLDTILPNLDCFLCGLDVLTKGYMQDCPMDAGKAKWKVMMLLFDLLSEANGADMVKYDSLSDQYETPDAQGNLCCSMSSIILLGASVVFNSIKYANLQQVLLLSRVVFILNGNKDMVTAKGMQMTMLEDTDTDTQDSDEPTTAQEENKTVTENVATKKVATKKVATKKVAKKKVAKKKTISVETTKATETIGKAEFPTQTDNLPPIQGSTGALITTTEGVVIPPPLPVSTPVSDGGIPLPPIP